MWQLAWDSTQVLGRAFLATVRGLPETETSPATLAGACPIVDGRTVFYLQVGLQVGDGNDGNDDPCAGLDWYMLVYLTLLVHTISWTTRWLLWEPAVNALARRSHHPTWDRTTCRKVSMNLTSALFFTISGFFVWRILSPKPWLLHPMQWFIELDDWTLTADFKFYYLLYAARFLSDIVSLQFEVGRNWNTFVTAWIHHLVTLGLVFGSAYSNYIRGGGVIMFFFDWADPPLLLAKSCKYLTQGDKDSYQWAANRLFEVFAFLFILTRNIMYNFVVFYPLRDMPRSAVPHRILLVLLVLLQTHWCLLIIKAVQRQSKNEGRVDDVRETAKDADQKAKTQ
jgi:hypothetical protein